MLYPNHWWHRLTPTAHHRIELVVIAALAFAAGLAMRSPGRSAISSFTDREAALPALTAPATNNQSVAAASTGAELQRAMELYREGERALYPRTERVGPPTTVDQDLQRAMELYRQGEQALYRPTARVIPPPSIDQELQHAMELYREGERALYPGR